jgi:site-specific DNA recombinase
MKSRPKAAVGYIRVSTEGQAQNGVSLDAQRDRIQTWASQNGYSLAAIHVDSGISGGKLTNRPAAQKALAEACRRKAALVVYSLSRLARSTKDAIETSERLHKAGADLVSLSEAIDTTTAAGKMVFRMLAVLAEFERDLVSERTTTAMQHLKSQNRRVGRWLPYGFDLAADGQHLTEIPAEQQTIRLIRQWHDGGQSLRTIADTLNARGIPAKQGGAWSHVAIHRVLQGAA